MTGFKKSFQKLLKLVKRSDENKKLKLSEETSKKEIQKSNEANISSTSEIIPSSSITIDQITKEGDIISEQTSNKILNSENKQKTERAEPSEEVPPSSCDVLLPQNTENTTANKPTAIVKPCHKPESEVGPDVEEIKEVKNECELDKNHHELDVKKESAVEEIIEPLTDNNGLQKHATNDVLIDHANAEDDNEIVSSVTDENVIEQAAKVAEVTQETLDDLAAKIKKCDEDIQKYQNEIKRVDTNNEQMLIVVDEFEKTIKQIVQDKEKENVYLFIQKENAERERNIVVADLENVERAFSDLSHKFERTKDVVTSFSQTEECLKQDLSVLTQRLKTEEEKFDKKKEEAEKQLSEAQERLSVTQKTGEREIARLTALLRKSEMSVASMEDKIKLKASENQDLTAMCDDLLSKCDQIASGSI